MVFWIPACAGMTVFSDDRFWPILLKNSFFGAARKITAPLTNY
jgi:hypothetical protein